jgi:surfactin synthase thioesterase subunit
MAWLYPVEKDFHSQLSMQQLTLIALAHAGGSANALVHLRRHLAPAVRLVPLDLPGRGSRFREPLMAARQPLVEKLATELARTLPRPYALFGHSLGGMLSFELAHALIARGCEAPRALCVAAAPAPCSQGRRRPPETWETDEALIASLRSLGGTPPELFQQPELLELFLPVVRADFRLCDDIPVPPLGPLPCPVHVYAGERDNIEHEALSAWRNVTERGHSLTFFDGDHFFLRARARELCTLLGEHLLRPYASAPRTSLT